MAKNTRTLCTHIKQSFVCLYSNSYAVYFTMYTIDIYVKNGDHHMHMLTNLCLGGSVVIAN